MQKYLEFIVVYHLSHQYWAIGVTVDKHLRPVFTKLAALCMKKWGLANLAH